jgi:DNA polymerase I-like protein with 3'-5' exonuclease and polymerase domains
MAKKKQVHVGGQQLPLLTPKADWTQPTELPDLRRQKLIAVDTENRDAGLAAKVGPGWYNRNGHVAGVGLAWKGGSNYFPIAHPETPNQFEHDNFKQWFLDHQRAGCRFVFHNGPYDVGWLDADLGVPPPPEGQIDDTVAMATIVDENRYSYELDTLCRIYGLPGKDEFLLREAAAAYGYEDSVKENLWRLPARYVGAYGAADAEQTLLLAGKLREVIDREDTGEAYQLECDLIPMVHAMRKRGIRVNVDYVEQSIVKLHKARDEVLKDLSDKLGRTVHIDLIRQNKFMTETCDHLKVSYPRTKTGMGSFTKDWTRKHEHWFPRLTAKAEQLEDMAEKFMTGFLKNFTSNGRIHASINQFRSDDGGTRSHRFSYSNPPLQQAPSRDEEFMEMFRGAFEPEPGEKWGALDYSQQEYRLIVHYAEVHKCTRASEAADKYRADPRTDFHTMVAEMTGLDRKPAKDTNFAKAFGAGVAKFALMIGKSKEEAQAIYDQYDEEMPFVSELAEKCAAAANKKGYILLIDGARSHFDLWEARERGENYDERGKYLGPVPLAEAQVRWEGLRLRRAYTHKAMNRKIQGSAARQTKMAMRECWREGIVPLIQMHDELGFSFADQVPARRAEEIMRDVVKLRVPVVVDAEFGPSWGQAKHPWGRAKAAPAGVKKRKSPAKR